MDWKNTLDKLNQKREIATPPLCFAGGLLLGGLMGLVSVPISIAVVAGTVYYVIGREKEE